MTKHELELLAALISAHGIILKGAEALDGIKKELEKFYRTQNGEILTDPRCRVLLKSYQNYLQSVTELADCTNDSIISMGNEMKSLLQSIEDSGNSAD